MERPRYNQTAIADCGHIVDLWPAVGSPNGNNLKYICDDCTRLQYGIPKGENILQFVWVSLVPEKKKPAVRKPRIKKPKPKNPFLAFMEQEGLF